MQDSILGCATGCKLHPSPAVSAACMAAAAVHLRSVRPSCDDAWSCPSSVPTFNVCHEGGSFATNQAWVVGSRPLRRSSHRLTSLPYNTGGAGDRLDGMVLTPYTLPGQAYSQYNLGLSCAPRSPHQTGSAQSLLRACEAQQCPHLCRGST